MAEIITPDTFYVPSHQHIYQAALELYHQEKPTDLMTVTTWLADHKLLKKIGGKNKNLKWPQLSHFCPIGPLYLEKIG